MIACLLPWSPASYGWILSTGPNALQLCLLSALYNSFTFDYMIRNSLSQSSIPQSTVEQIATIAPIQYNEQDSHFIRHACRLNSRILPGI